MVSKTEEFLLDKKHLFDGFLTTKSFAFRIVKVYWDVGMQFVPLQSIPSLSILNQADNNFMLVSMGEQIFPLHDVHKASFKKHVTSRVVTLPKCSMYERRMGDWFITAGAAEETVTSQGRWWEKAHSTKQPTFTDSHIYLHSLFIYAHAQVVSQRLCNSMLHKERSFTNNLPRCKLPR